MIPRRTFIAGLGAAAAWPLAARAQQPVTPVIGYLSSDSPQSNRATAGLAATRKGLADAGYVEGHNFSFEYRWGNGQEDRVPELAADLVRRRVAIITVVGGGLTARAAKAATSSIPIVFSIGADPVATGLVRSLSRPGGNITGVTNLNSELNAKRIELLAELIPNATTIGFLMNPNSPAKADIIERVRGAGQALGRNIEILDARTGDEIERAFAAAAERRLQAVAVSGDNVLNPQAERIAALARKHEIAVISPIRDLPAGGGLMSYGTEISDLTREAGIYVARILKGEKPGDLPVIQPTKFELVINLKAAKALGLTVPLTLQAAADEVIE